jgi:hypothetical protein
VSLRRLFLVATAFVAPFLFQPRTAHAQATDVIRGRVIGPDSLPVEGATVTVTSIANNTNKQIRTDKNGRFTIPFPGGDGDYWVNIAALGFNAKRFEVKRTADQEILVADAKLTRAATQLDAVKVNAQRDKVSRNLLNSDISGTERPVASGNLPADLQGDLAAMVSNLPGVTYIPSADGGPGGFSILGLGADQNNTTLNGLNFGGNNLPRDAAVSTSLTTSPYDVSRGGFSGGQINLRTRPGSNIINRTMSANVDAPRMQWTDRAAQSLGQQYTNLSVSGLVSGPIQIDKSFYNLSYQVDRRMNDLQTLLNTDALGLQTAGIAQDSVTRLLNLLQASRIPATVGGIPANRVSDRASIFGSFDLIPPTSVSGQAFNVALSGNWGRTTPSLSSLGSGFGAELPSHSGDRNNWGGSIQGRHSSYFGFGILTETTLGFAQSRNYSSPYLSLPSGAVRVNSTFDDGSSGVRTVSFGGNPSMNQSLNTSTGSFMNQLSWFSADNKHRLKLTSELRHETYTQDLTSNELGSYDYNSLTDLGSNAPSRFTRQLSPRRRSQGQFVGALSLGDAWRKTPDLQIQYGLRLDANQFTSLPTKNPDVERIFGVRNNDLPNRIYLSPRVGFSWTHGTAAQIAAFDGAVRGPRAVIRGGIGMFQNTPGTQLISNVLDNTGLPSGVQQLTCSGAATPIPDWGAYLSNPGMIPDHCADGTGGSVFANNSPNVTLFDPSYAAQRSVRSNLQWSGTTIGNRFYTTIDATYSRNLDQPGSFDLNFNPTARFNLGDEAGRPVYVQPSSIAPTSGAIASRDARVSQLFSRVSELRSDLQSESKQVSVRVSPFSFSSGFNWNLSYVFSHVREMYRGFNSTVGDPRNTQWGRATMDSRHQVMYTLGYNFFDAVRVSWFGSFRSPYPFTPLVSGDVNGDGYSNDRAFIFDPSKTSDPALAAGMQSLLANGSGAAKECLRSQLGTLAGRNSCQGPWTTSATLNVSFNPVKARMPQRANIAFQISNPLTAADLLLHGENKLHGWGQSVFPDQALLYVRGFDPQTNRYKYDVNQRFGATSVAQSAIRAPVTLTAMMRFDVGPTRERQTLTMMLDRGRTSPGTKFSEPMIKGMYSQNVGVSNPMAQLLRSADTLKLTQVQADSVAALNRWFTVRLDSIWSPVAKYLAELPEKYDQDAAYDRYRTARQTSVDLLIKIAPQLKSLLSPDQTRKLPAFIATSLDQRYLAAVRSGTAGLGGGPMMMMGGGGPMIMDRVGAEVQAAGGGTVIRVMTP